MVLVKEQFKIKQFIATFIQENPLIDINNRYELIIWTYMKNTFSMYIRIYSSYSETFISKLKRLILSKYK